MTRVLIAGSGVAAVEAALALHALGGERLEIDLFAPAAELHVRPWSVLTPFGADAAPRIDLAGLVHELGLGWRRDSLAAVEPRAHRVLTRGGERLPYDLLVVATGARSQEAIPGAVTFRGPLSAGAVEGVLDRAAGNPQLRLVFAAPAGAKWALPLYELALMSSAFLRERNVADPNITVVTGEAQPLEALGADAADAVRAALEHHDIQVVTGVVPETATEGGLWLRGGGLVGADVVVALGEIVGPRIPGLPHDDAGFIPVDEHGRVRDCDDVFAAGDATSFPIKHGGLAAQQADAVAETIAVRVGNAPSAAPFRPVVHAMLLAGDAPLYICADLATGAGVVSSDPLWSPVDKIAGRYLSPYLASGAATGATLDVTRQPTRA
jgi:sulfide:quinone oxidoreductase